MADGGSRKFPRSNLIRFVYQSPFKFFGKIWFHDFFLKNTIIFLLPIFKDKIIDDEHKNSIKITDLKYKTSLKPVSPPRLKFLCIQPKSIDWNLYLVFGTHFFVDFYYIFTTRRAGQKWARELEK